MSDFANRVITTFRSDTSQAEAAVKRLRGVERDRAKQTLDDLNSQNDKLEKSIATWVKVGAVVGGVVLAYKGLQAAAKSYLEDVRLESAAAGANIDALRASTHGLVETDNLLAFAGKAQHAIWKLNQQEMELVLQGANALRIQMGTELQPTVEKLTESITKGSSRALKEFGIEAKDKTELLRVMQERIASLRGEASLVGDDFERAGVQWADAVDDLKGAMGRLAVSLTPVVSLLADMAAKFAAATGAAMDFFSEQRRLTDEWWAGRGVGQKDWFRTHQTQVGPTLAQEINPLAPPSISIDDRLAQMRARVAPSQAQMPSWMTGVGPLRVPDLEVKRVTADGFKIGGMDWSQNVGTRVPTPIESVGAGRAGLGGGAIDQSQLPAGLESDQAFEQFQARGAKFMEQAQRWKAEAATLHQQTILEALFGTPAEIDLFTVSLKSAHGAVSILADASGAAMDAWITGQKSLGAAFKSAIAEGLRGLAVQATVEALKHTAFGVGDLAFFNYGGAAQHFAAAGLFAGVAVAAGTGAKLLGAGGGGKPSLGGAGGGAGAALGGGGRSSSSSGSDQRQTVIVLGRDFLALPDLQQRQLTYEAIRLATDGQVSTTNIRRK